MRPWPLVVSACCGGKSVQLEIVDVLPEGGLIVLDREDVVGVFVLDQVAGRLGLGVQGIGGDDDALQGQPETGASYSRYLNW